MGIKQTIANVSADYMKKDIVSFEIAKHLFKAGWNTAVNQLFRVGSCTLSFSNSVIVNKDGTFTDKYKLIGDQYFFAPSAYDLYCFMDQRVKINGRICEMHWGYDDQADCFHVMYKGVRGGIFLASSQDKLADAFALVWAGLNKKKQRSRK